MNKATFTALGKVFTAEINDRLPFQSKAKIYRQLCEDGLLAPMERKFGSGIGLIAVTGYELTHAGRILYCSNC